jgi:hypothetical protein
VAARVSGVSRREGRGVVRRLLSSIGLIALAASVAGCGFAAQVVVTPPPSAAAVPSIAPAVATVRSQVAAALAPAGFRLIDPTDPYRPGESPSLAAAPRAVVQAVMAAAPQSGYIVLYQLADPAAAVAAAKEDAAYISSGVGRVQFANDARFVIRQVGPVVVFYSWSPGSSPAPNDEQALATALSSLGQGFTVQP